MDGAPPNPRPIRIAQRNAQGFFQVEESPPPAKSSLESGNFERHLASKSAADQSSRNARPTRPSSPSTSRSGSSRPQRSGETSRSNHDRSERVVERQERGAPPERERFERSDKYERHERNESGKSERHERNESGKSERHERSDKYERSDRERSERTERTRAESAREYHSQPPERDNNRRQYSADRGDKRIHNTSAHIDDLVKEFDASHPPSPRRQDHHHSGSRRDHSESSPRSRPANSSSGRRNKTREDSFDFGSMENSIDSVIPARNSDRHTREKIMNSDAYENERKNGDSMDISTVTPDRNDRLRSSTTRREQDRGLSPNNQQISSPRSPEMHIDEEIEQQQEQPRARGRRAEWANKRTQRSRSRSISKTEKDEEGRDLDRTGYDESFEVSEAERLEFEKQKKDLERQNAARKAAERREAEMVAKERERRTAQDRERRNSDGRGGSSEFPLTARSAVDESILVPDYLTALMTTLRNDDTLSPVPEDFLSRDAYRSWRQDMRRSFQEVLNKMIKYRFLVRPEPSRAPESSKLYFRVIEARDLVGKEGRARTTFCDIEYGNLAMLSKSKSKRDIFRTEVVEDSLNPRWDQKMTIQVVNQDDQISLQVRDKKDHFLGRVILNMGDLIYRCSQQPEHAFQKWYNLEPRDSKNKDKYVGGQIKIGARIDEEKKQPSKSYQEIQDTLTKMEVDNRALFDILLRACLVLDLFTPRKGRAEVLSPEAITMLKAWARTWGISDSYQVISYLKILFEKYTVDSISISDLLKAFHFLYAAVKKNGSFNSSEMNTTIQTLEKMKEVCGGRVLKYKELFPKNQPRGALESTILILRMIHRFPTFRTIHPELQESFRDELRIMMTESCIGRFQRFKELSTPLDEGDVESVIEGINKLADLVNHEIELDVQHFQPAFAQELDIVRLTAENHLKYFTLILEDGGDLLGGDSAVATASHHVFALYKTLRLMAERYAKSVAGLTAMSTSYIEGWFAPFMYKWLKELSKKTIGWVEEAVKADNFVSEAEGPDGVPMHSSSITDVFVAIYSELEFITDLQWSDPLQNAHFFQMFAKTVNTAIEQYCDAIAMAEKKVDASTAVSDFTKNLLGRSSEPQDIEQESCAKLRNIAFAMTKLRELYRLMNVSAITKTLQAHRKTLGRDRKNASEEPISGTFKVHTSYAENLKPTSKSGVSSPYLLAKVPEGTIMPPEEELPSSKKKRVPSDNPPPPTPPVVLTGSSCELFRSRVINETLNPTWDETHTVILPPVERIDVSVMSKNLLTADDVAGTATIDLSLGTRLRRKLLDHQTHDVYLELEPQGRLLLRLTLEGEQEDVDFWFRRTNERLLRTRDGFLRSYTAKIKPFCAQILQKALKDNEAAPLPSKSYFTSLISAVEYSDKTVAGHSVKEPAQESDAILALNPLVEYLEKNLDTICSQLPSLMAQAVIEKIWTDVLTISIDNIIPPLFGLHSHKHLSIRQVSIAKLCLSILRDFMHGDGGEFGLAFETLDTPLYHDFQELTSLYNMDSTKLRREYELSLLGGKDKELILRLIRLLAVPDSNDAKWVDNQLTKRRETRQ